MRLQTDRIYRLTSSRVVPFLLALALVAFAACKQQTSTQPARSTPEVPAGAAPAQTARATPASTSATPMPNATQAAATKKGDPQAMANTVEATLKEFTVTLPKSLPPGPTVFQVKNDGTLEHGLEIKGQGIDQKLAENLKPGESGTLSVDLKPGTYEALCPVGNHAERGMSQQITVMSP